ncbi:MAG: hypothetical protein ABIU87_01955 [Ornithinibacter sp.]
MAYKGFTTITNQGGDNAELKKDVGRSIMISIAPWTVTSLLLAVTVAGSRSVDQVVAARDQRWLQRPTLSSAPGASA